MKRRIVEGEEIRSENDLEEKEENEEQTGPPRALTHSGILAQLAREAPL